MLSVKHAKLAKDILILILIGVFSFFVLTSWLPRTEFIEHSMESVETSSDTVMKFSAATLAASLAITTLPDDFASPLADSLADMNIYFVAILVVLFLEKLLIVHGVELAFSLVIPLACAFGVAAILLRRDGLKGFGVRLAVLGLALALVVPCSTHLTNYVAKDLNLYVEDTIADTEAGTEKLHEAMNDTSGEKSIFERLSDLFQTAIRDISDLMLHYRDSFRKCMNSIAILILTNCLMPIMNFFILRWVLKETFHIALPVPQMKYRRRREDDTDDSDHELMVTGG